MLAAQCILCVGSAYVLLGLLFTGLFQWRGVSQVDPATRGAPWSFRLVIVPGLVLLWPVMLQLWLRSARHEDHASPSAQLLQKRHRIIWLILGPVVILGLLILLLMRPAPPFLHTPTLTYSSKEVRR